jgi:hypothetical protein
LEKCRRSLSHFEGIRFGGRRLASAWLVTYRIGPADSQGIGNAVDVIEPGSNQGDLQYPDIVKAHFSQPVEVLGRDLISRFRQAHGEIDDRAIGGGKFGFCMVPPQLGGEFLVEAGPAKKLDVAFRSVEALVLDRHDRGDHFLLAAGQGQVRLKENG